MRRSLALPRLSVGGLVCAVLVGLALAAWESGPRGVTSNDVTPPALAFFGIILAIGQWIWNAFQAASTFILKYLVWAVQALWTAVHKLVNALSWVGAHALDYVKKIWSGVRALYDHVLRPVGQWFFRQVDAFARWMDRILGPVLRWLQKLRAVLLDWYGRFIKPVFDLFGLARGFLRVLASLHLDFARRLDEKLGRIEGRLHEPFDWLFARVNQLIDWVDRIITLDGYLQRVTLLRSTWRYQVDLAKQWWATLHRSPTAAEQARLAAAPVVKTVAEHAAEVTAAIVTHEGPLYTFAAEAAEDIALMLRRR